MPATTYDEPLDREIAVTMLRLLSSRATTSSICPSEVARALREGGNWRVLMPPVRAVASRLRDSGIVELSARGVRIDDLATHRGPLRITRGPRFRPPR